MEKFRQFYTAHRDSLFGYLVRRSGNPALAADLVQESFTRYLEQYRDREPPSPALLFTIGRNLLHDQMRKNRANRELIDDTPDTVRGDEEQAYIQREQARNVFSALRQLDDEDRDILALVVSSEMTYREIAAIRGCSETTIKVRVHRARQKLRRLLAREKS